MTDKTKATIEAMKPFAFEGDEFTWLKQVAITGGCTYVTDGRAAVKVTLDEDVPDDMPDKFPLKSLNGIFDDAKSKANLFFKMTRDGFSAYIGAYKTDYNRWVAEERSNRRQWKRSLEKATCPCCGEPVYIDGDELLTEDDVDKAIEENPITPDMHEWDAKIRLGAEEGNAGFFQFRFINNLLALSPEWRVGGVDRNVDGTIQKLYGETPDGKMQFVVMSLRCDSPYDEGRVKAVIECKEFE